MKEKKARVEDALHATRAAVEEGVVPGGGVALLRAVKGIANLKGANEDQNVGINILRKAVEEPLRQIVANAGADASVVLNAVVSGKGNYGFNAATGEYGDMVKLGIIDPTKVTRLALQNATSVAGLLLTTEAMIAEAPKQEKEAAIAARSWRHGRDDVSRASSLLLEPKPRPRGAFFFLRASRRLRGERRTRRRSIGSPKSAPDGKPDAGTLEPRGQIGERACRVEVARQQVPAARIEGRLPVAGAGSLSSHAHIGSGGTISSCAP